MFRARLFILLCFVVGYFGVAEASLLRKFSLLPLKMKQGGSAPNESERISSKIEAKSQAKPMKTSGKEGIPLTYIQTLIAGAVSRTMAQAIVHPINAYKTILQLKDPQAHGNVNFNRLLKGLDAQFILSLPHGALHYFAIDQVKSCLSLIMPKKLDFLSDFTASAVSTVICSAVSTPQMVLADRLMAGVYPSLPVAVNAIWQNEGLAGLYTGWWPALVQKIPSYGLTWMVFQQLQRTYTSIAAVPKPSDRVNFVLGAVASATSVMVMNPMDTIKTRLTTQAAGDPNAYKGVTDTFLRIVKEEGVGAFYKSLAPRLISVVPMMAIQFGIYEGIRNRFRSSNERKEQRKREQLSFLETAEINSDVVATSTADTLVAAACVKDGCVDNVCSYTATAMREDGGKQQQSEVKTLCAISTVAVEELTE